MKKVKDEMYKSIRYIIPILFGFLCVLILRNFDSITQFFSNNLTTISNLLAPFFIGFGIAYIFNQPMKALERKFKTKRGLSVLIIYGAVVCSIIFAWFFIVPTIKSNINDIYTSLPGAIEQAQIKLNSIASNIKLDISSEEVKTAINNFITNILLPISSTTISFLSGALINTTSAVVNSVVNIFLGIVISIYLLLSKEKAIYSISILSRKFLKSSYEGVKEFINILDKNIGVYLVAKALDSLIYGVICTIALSIIGSKYALLLGAIAGITNMIPFFGPIIGTVIIAAVNLFFSFNKALIVLIVMIIIQQLESAIIEPFFVGKQVGVPPIFTILAVTVASKYLGLLGILLSVPVTGVLLIYVNRVIEKESKLLESKSKEHLETPEIEENKAKKDNTNKNNKENKKGKI